MTPRNFSAGCGTLVVKGFVSRTSIFHSIVIGIYLWRSVGLLVRCLADGYISWLCVGAEVDFTESTFYGGTTVSTVLLFGADS